VPSERNTTEVLAKTDKLRQTVTNRAGFIRLSFVIYSGVPGPHPCRWSLSCLGSLFCQSVAYIVHLSTAKKLQFTASFSWVFLSWYKNLDTLFSNFDVLLTVHLSIFISVINQLDAQNFCFTISLFHACTCFEHMCSKLVESWNKLIVKQKFCASNWLITEIKPLFSVDGVARVTTVYDCPVLQLISAMVCAGGSRPALVCDQ